MKKFISFRDGVNFGTAALILGALLAFEVFNYESTRYGLDVLFGSTRVAIFSLSTPMAAVLAIAACGIDFAGIARVFTPERGRDEPIWVWILTAGWLLSAMINAALTWWTVLLLVSRFGNLENPIIPVVTMIRAVPIVIAIFVLLTRLSIIGALSIAGEDFFRNIHRPRAKKISPPKTAVRRPAQPEGDFTFPIINLPK